MARPTGRSHFFLTITPVFVSIGLNSDQGHRIPLQKYSQKPVFARILPVIALMAVAPIAACEPATVAEAEAEPAVVIQPPCDARGALKTSLYGGIETTLSWSGSDMSCESMPRPNGAGLRLRLAGQVSGQTLAFIIALPQLQPGQAGVESPSNVTATVEGSGRFFSTPDLDTCWTDVLAQSSVQGTSSDYLLQGELFCIAPLGELNGDAAVSIARMSFTAPVSWN